MESLEIMLKNAIESAKIGGEILKEGYGTLYEISTKEGKNNIVTEYDLKSEKAIIANIKKYYPDHSILAEESGKSNSENSEYRWIIDPLDGTVNFSHNIPIFSVSIAVEKDGEIIIGVIYHPLLDESQTTKNLLSVISPSCCLSLLIFHNIFMLMTSY